MIQGSSMCRYGVGLRHEGSRGGGGRCGDSSACELFNDLCDDAPTADWSWVLKVIHKSNGSARSRQVVMSREDTVAMKKERTGSWDEFRSLARISDHWLVSTDACTYCPRSPTSE